MSDYLNWERPAPAGPKRAKRANHMGYTGFVPKAKPARFCECGQKLSIANEGRECFSCSRKKKKNKS